MTHFFKNKQALIKNVSLQDLTPSYFRGPIINKKALMKALDSGHLGGVALDVYWKEPPEPNDPILDYPNVMATPHIAGVSDVSYQGIVAKVAENIIRVMEGKLPLHCVNSDLKASWLRDK